MVKKHSCGICNKEFSRPAHHLRQAHGILDYQKYYDEYCMKDLSEKQCPECGNETSFLGIFNGYSRHCSSKCSNSSDIVQSKKMDSYRSRYGTDYAVQSGIVKQKIIDTLRKNYQCDTPLKSKIIRDRVKKSYMDKYGVDNPNKSDKIKLKKRVTCEKRYGGPSPMSSSDIRDKSKITCMERYGVDNVAQTPENREIFRNNWIKSIEEKKLNGRKLYPRSGIIEEKCIKYLQDNIRELIKRDVVIHNYFPDGLIESLNLVIEFDEPWHKKKWSILHDNNKNSDMLSYGYDICRISQESFKNPEKLVKDFQLLILELSGKPLNHKGPEVFRI